ncbi:MAG: HPr family phosphocarrier protein [Verrucomicrobiota bacterium]
MSLELTFVCPLLNGIHARPASALEEVARNFTAEISLVNERTGSSANAKSVLAIVGTDIRHRDPCRFVIGGPDANDALDALNAFLRHEFPRCDEALPPAASRNGEIPLPPGTTRGRRSNPAWQTSCARHRARPDHPHRRIACATYHRTEWGN